MSIESFIEFGKATEKVATASADLSQALEVVSQIPCFTTPPWKENPSVMISIKPQYCELIASGRKTIEVRKTRPKTETPFKCYIYETKGKTDTPFIDEDGHLDFHGRGQVIGEFICDCIDNFEGEFWNDEVFENINLKYNPSDYGEDCDYRYSTIAKNKERNWLNEKSCLTWEELRNYIGKGIHDFYGWHISGLVIYDKPKELSEFYTHDNKAVQKCENRIQTYSNFTDTGYIKNGMYCDYRDDWCIKCKRKPLKRPFQSWGYAENYAEDT